MHKDQAIRVRDATKAGEVDEATWKKLDMKAKDKQLEYIMDCDTAYKMMEKYKSMYSTKSTALQIICRGQLENIKLKNYEKVEEFFVHFEQAYNKFKAAGGTLPEKEKMRYLIRALPASYSLIGSFIDLVPEAQQTVNYLKSKIQEKIMTVPDNEKRKNVNTFNVKTKGQCYNCGREGHLKKDCWRQL